ncbi:hypothetical protein RM190_08675 [Paracoccus sp. CPCC 101403]|uniref:Uncharacterized protein n=2 Tax=Paracoccus broussonetiae TaxID=3075834 RepID=A0ABU3EDP9_9RHOB|nr:hypothetical protein [Paracoccus sp. CPCC 101403]
MRLLIYVPGSGFGKMLDDMHAWLSHHAGQDGYAIHGAGMAGIRDVMAVYLMHPSLAAEFFEQFPALELLGEPC